MAKKACTILGVICLMAGIALVFVGVMAGGLAGNFMPTADGRIVYVNGEREVDLFRTPSFLYRFGDWDDYYWSSGGQAAPAGSGTSQNLPAGLSAASLLRLELDISPGHLIVVQGSEPGLTVNGNMPFTQSFRSGTWHIEAKHNNFSPAPNDPNGSRFFWDGVDYTTTFTLTLPAGLQEVDIDLSVGTVTIDNLAATTVEIDTEIGNVSVTGGITANSLSLSTDMGNMTVAGIAADNIDVDTDMGNITLAGSVTRNFTADCDMGRIDAKLNRPAAYSYQIEVSAGHVNLDGISLAYGSRSGGTPGATPFFDLETSMGSIDVTFV